MTVDIREAEKDDIPGVIILNCIERELTRSRTNENKRYDCHIRDI
jgi:hypothetical protein